MDEMMKNLYESAEYIKGIIGEEKVEIALVLGSGLGALGDNIEEAVYIDYHDIPHFPVSTVPGHKGRLVIGKLEGRRVMCMQGRFHYYEGWSMEQCVYPIRTMFLLGIKSLLLTNAAGCVNTAWKPGDIMLITDHIKLFSDNPCRGANHDELGARFFDMGSAYSKTLQNVARNAAATLDQTLREGVYMFFAGPNFETPAEVRFARFAGADAAGMSTVPEAIAASQMRMNVLGFSCMTNMAAGILDQPLNHEEVIETGNRVSKTFQALVRECVRTWPLELC
ncbi:MAG: purine-nucleoside phosphorylase [Spirochaetales bacterium]|nr:purine-nucleoside phosphorylase [Candidatus Physcosoma equi]